VSEDWQKSLLRWWNTTTRKGNGRPIHWS